MEYVYYVSTMYDTLITKRTVSGAIYTLDYKLDSKGGIIEFTEYLKSKGYKDPIILFFKQLNE